MAPVRPFFDRYMDAYLKCDPKAFSDFFDYPCLIVDSNGNHVIRHDHDIENYVRPFVAFLRSSGLKEIEFDQLSAQEINQSECFCTNRYKILKADKKLIGDMEYHYFLVRADDKWRIKFARMGHLHYWIQ